MRRALGALAVVAAVLVAAPPAGAAGVGLQPVGTFDQPIYAASPPGDPSRVMVVEKSGRIRVVHDGRSSTFLDISDRVLSGEYEQGLWSMAFDPHYDVDHRFYVFYSGRPAGPPTDAGGDDLVISAFTATSPDRAEPAGERLVLRIPHRLDPYDHGGMLQTGPDGMLWIGTGQAGGALDKYDNAQRLDPATDDPAQGRDALLGKILRIDPHPGDGCGGHCTIPVGNPGLPQPEVWAYGLRHPWRFSFDRVTGDLLIGDVGDHSWEEVDVAAGPGDGAGANYGWPLYEGLHPVDGAAPPAGCCTAPAFERSHAAPDDFNAIIGGYVVRDPDLPALAGRYLYASEGDGRIRSIDLAGGQPADDRDTGLAVRNLVSFGEDSCGRIYTVSIEGAVSRLSQGPSVHCAGAGDTVGPRIAVSAPRQRAWRAGVLRLRVVSGERCRATLAVAAGRPVPLVLRRGAQVVVVPIDRALRQRLLRRARRPGPLRLLVRVTATDGAGNRARATAELRLVR